jgi:hypothetical protein
MKINQSVLCTLALAVTVSHASEAGAQSLDATLSDSTVTVTQGATVVNFYATITDPSATATVYLNGDSSTTSTSLLTVDDTPFFNNAPLLLAPGQSSGLIELLAVDLPANTPQGLYSGNVFSILGGADGNAVDDVADVNFSVDVTASTMAAPEMEPASAIGSLTLLAGGIAVLCGGRRLRGVT